MSEPVPAPRWPWPAALAVVGALAAALGLYLQGQLEARLGQANRLADQHLRRNAEVLSSNLQAGRYQQVEPLMKELGASDPAIAGLELVAANGFVLGAYRRAGEAARYLDLERRISYSYRGEATLRQRTDLDAVHRDFLRDAAVLAAIFAAFAALLAAVLHLALRRLAEARRLRSRTVELDRARKAIALSEDRLRAIIETEPECVKVLAPDGSLREMNAAGLAMVEAASLAEAQSRKLVEYVRPEFRAAFRQLHERVMAGQTGLLQFEAEGLRGTRRWLETHAAPLRDAEGRVVEVLSITRDVTERRQADEKIRGLARVHAVMSNINALIVRAPAAEELFRETCRIAHELGGFPAVWMGAVDRAAMRIRPVASHGVPEGFFDRLRLSIDARAPEGIGIAGHAVRAGEPIISSRVADDARIQVKVTHAHGSTGSLAVLPILVGGESRAVLVLHAAAEGFFDDEEMRLLLELSGDIGLALDHLEKSQRLNHLAYYDGLTGAANRTLFLERLGQLARGAARHGEVLAVMLVDIERFRTINDSVGRFAGDELLKEAARRLERRVDATRVARTGGDQFAVAIPPVASREAVASAAEAILAEAFGPPFRVGQGPLRVGARAGIAVHPDDGTEAEALLASAEAALKEARAHGDRLQFHSAELARRSADEFALEGELRQAQERGEFVLHYQPKVEAATGRICGAEALIRWRSPSGLVPPARFIPLMERTGLIVEVGAWVLAQAVRDHERLSALGPGAPRIAVNVSVVQLRRAGFLGAVERAIGEGARPAGIDLEITESVVMEDIEARIEMLRAARALGVSLVIDDFGTGYSSLAYLARLPVQALKIDRSFVAGMLSDAGTLGLVRTIVSLAHSMRLAVVAEGVENEDQALALRSLGCDELQGYHCGRPMPIEELEALLRGNREGPAAAAPSPG